MATIYCTATSLDFDQFLPSVGAVVCGANTYAWVHRELTHDGSDFTWPYEQPSWVVTHRDLDLPEGVQTFAGDITDLHAAATEAAAGMDVWIVGAETSPASSPTRVCSTRSGCTSARSSSAPVSRCSPGD